MDLRTMTLFRTVVVLLMALVMPSQLVFASASAYCRHEADAGQARHVGHHAHVHASAAQAGGDVDSDCGLCHAAAATGLIQTMAVVPVSRPTVQHAPPASHRAPASAPSRAPDRPQWRHLVT